MDHYDEYREKSTAIRLQMQNRAFVARDKLRDVPLSRFTAGDMVWLALMYERLNTDYYRWLPEAEKWIADNLTN